MAHPAVAVLESALRARKLDRTLTTTLPSWEWTDPASLLPMDVPLVDACLRGGLPRGQLSELSGPRSSRTDDAAASAHGGRHATGRDCRPRRYLRSARCGLGRSGGCRSRSAAVDPGGSDRDRGIRRPSDVRDPTDATDRSRAQSAQPRAAGRRVRSRGDRSGRCATREAQADSVHDVAARAACHRRERHGVCAADAGAAGAQCRRADVVAGWSIDMGRRVRSQPSLQGVDLRVRVVSPRKRIDGDVRVRAVAP